PRDRFRTKRRALRAASADSAQPAAKAAPPPSANSNLRPDEQGEFHAPGFPRRRDRPHAKENQIQHRPKTVAFAAPRKPGKRDVDIRTRSTNRCGSSDEDATSFFVRSVRWQFRRQQAGSLFF